MQIGIKNEIDAEKLRYYNNYYDILHTPDFDENSRLLTPVHGIKMLGHSTNKICRFCGKDENEVTFKKIAHVFPESIGNNALASHYECDTCNQYFGNSIENEYANFFSLYHSIMQIDGKSGVPKCCFKVPCQKRTNECMKYCVNISYKGTTPYLANCREVDKKYINITNNSAEITKPIGKCCPVAVFKAIVKMAISVMPIEELPFFSDAIKWILEPNHNNFYKEKKLLVRYEMIPGFNVTKYPHYCLFRRKRTIWNMPYMLFNLTYGCFSLFIEIPENHNHTSNLNFTNMPFPPIPFYTTSTGVWDLSKNQMDKGMEPSIVLNWNTSVNCINDVGIDVENGKSKIKYKGKEITS